MFLFGNQKQEEEKRDGCLHACLSGCRIPACIKTKQGRADARARFVFFGTYSCILQFPLRDPEKKRGESIEYLCTWLAGGEKKSLDISVAAGTSFCAPHTCFGIENNTFSSKSRGHKFPPRCLLYLFFSLDFLSFFLISGKIRR